MPESGLPGGGGATAFTGLSDTPLSYTGQAGKVLTVNPGETGVIFTTIGGSDGNGIYTGSGSLSANTEVTMGAFDLGFTGTGNVGIGTSTASEKLHVVGNGLIDDGSLTVQTTGAGNPAIITINGDKDNTNPDDDSVTSVFRMITDADVNPYGFNIDVLNGNAVSKTKFYHYKGGAAKKQIMFWDQAERVGIGSMTAMTSKLQVQADNAGTASVFLVEASTGADILRVTEDQKVGIGTGAAPAQKLHVQGNQYISGNLGIGTTTPTEKLEVIGGVRVDAFAANQLYVSTSERFIGSGYTSNPSGLSQTTLGISGRIFTTLSYSANDIALVTHSSGNVAIFTNYSSGQDVQLKTSAANDDVKIGHGATITLTSQGSTGNLGIGTTTPSQKLEVAGNTHTTGQGSFGTPINPNSQLQVTASGKIVGIVSNSSAITAGNGSAIRGLATSTSAVEIIGVDGEASGTNATGDRTGVRGNAITTGSRNHVGGKFVAKNGTQQNIGVSGTTSNGTTGTIIRGVSGVSLYTGASNAYGGYFSAQGTSTGENIGIFATAVNGANNYAAIFDAGNVGIGTTTPTQKLDVSGGMVVNANVVNQLYVNPSDTFVGINTTTRLDTKFNLDMFSVKGNIATNDGLVLTDPTTPANNYTAYLYNPNITTRGARLQMGRFTDDLGGITMNLSNDFRGGLIEWAQEDTASSQAFLGTFNAVNGFPSFELFDFGLQTTNKDVAINTQSGVGTSAMIIKKSNGNIGMGTMTPSAKLEVVGNVRVSGYSYLNTGDDAAVIFSTNNNLAFIKKTGSQPSLAVSNNNNFTLKRWNSSTITNISAGNFDNNIFDIENDIQLKLGVGQEAFVLTDTSDNNGIDPLDTEKQFQINTRSKTSITVDTLGRTTLGGTAANTEVILNTNDSTAIAAGLMVKNITGAQILALTPSNGMIAYATSTSGAISSVGFWGYENGAWVKL